MTTNRRVLLIIAWLFCSYVAGGIDYRYFQAKWPDLADAQRREDAGKAMTFVFAGPIYLFASLTQSGMAEYGIEWKWIVAPRLQHERTSDDH